MISIIILLSLMALGLATTAGRSSDVPVLVPVKAKAGEFVRDPAVRQAHLQRRAAFDVRHSRALPR